MRPLSWSASLAQYGVLSLWGEFTPLVMARNSRLVPFLGLEGPFGSQPAAYRPSMLSFLGRDLDTGERSGWAIG